jgi:hypothetical protein
VYNADSGLTSNSKTFTITPPQPQSPTITTISPENKQAGSGAFTLTVTGTSYYSGSKVRWNGADRTTTYTSSTQLTASITASDIASEGPATVTVYNADSGLTSNSKAFTITPPQPQSPTITTISPENKQAGSGAFTLTVTGTNYYSGSKVRWNGADRTTTYTSSTQLTASITASDIASAGSATVTVYNADSGLISNSKMFTITPQENPVPAITSISPVNATAGGSAFTLTVTGSNFVSSSKVRWNGADRTTTYVSATQLTAQVSSADIASVGTATVTVFNPLPGGGTSGGFLFEIKSGPTISAIAPSTKQAGSGAFTLTVTGTNYYSGSKVRWNGADRTTTFVSSTKVTASIPSSDIATAGSAQVTVFNPNSGLTSNSKTLRITSTGPRSMLLVRSYPTG